MVQKKQNQKIKPLSITLGFSIYWFTVIRDAVISAKLFQNQLYCWIIVKRNKTTFFFLMLVQSWGQNVFIENVGKKFDSDGMVKWTDRPFRCPILEVKKDLILKLRYPLLSAEFYILIFSSLGNYPGNEPSEIKIQFNIWRKWQNQTLLGRTRDRFSRQAVLGQAL